MVLSSGLASNFKRKYTLVAGRNRTSQINDKYFYFDNLIERI